MLNDSDPYIRFLLSRKNRLVYCSLYPGNGGDLLIRKGTLKLLSDLGIHTTAEPCEADVILYPGGCPTMYPQVMACISESLHTFFGAELVVGPATFRLGYTDWVGTFNRSASPGVALFARDPDSFMNLRKARLRKSIKIGLSHDPALYLRDSEWLDAQKSAVANEYVLAAFRRDHEMNTGIPGEWVKALRAVLPKGTFKKLTHWFKKRARRRKVDIARKLADSKLPLNEVDVSHLDFDSFVETVRCSKEVHTDRLHTMLLAAMLDKPVFAYRTSYGKLEGVYEQSLKGWTKVTFVSRL